MAAGSVGKNVPRREGPEKLRGAAKYIDDHVLPGCLHGVTYRSTIPSGRILKIDFDPSFPWSECVVVTAKDIPGKNCVLLIQEDQPVLAETRVNHPMEPIVLVAHERRETAYEALKHISVEYAPEEPVLTIEEALDAQRVVYAPGNVFKDILIDKGDVDKALAKADVVVDGTYRVPHQEQAYIENNGMAAYREADGTLVAMGSMQCPYYVHKSLVKAFGLPKDKVRVIQTATGGGFGGKEDYPSILAAHAGLLAWKAGRPVKMIYDRAEDMAATTKRHPAVVRHRTGVAKDGRLLSQDIEILMDGGAYMTLSPVVLSRGAIHSAGPYACPNVRVRAKALATNTPPNGAFRGFGAPQTLFAAEMQMEKIARTLRLDPAELRRRNVVKEGSSTATGQVLRKSVGASEVLERCLKSSGYAKKRKEHERWNKKAANPTWRGMGLSLIYHGGGFTGSGEVYLASQAGVSLSREGRLRVLTASTEIGQGTNTMFAQVTADTLGVPFDWVEVEVPDTAKVPDSGPTVASRTCMVVGRIVQRAALTLKDELFRAVPGYAKARSAWLKAAKAVCGASPERKVIADYQKAADIQWDDKNYRGDAYGAFGYAAMAADLEVDKTTFEVKVRKLTTAQDMGKAIHPLLAEGQIIGGSAQGLGWALYEKPVYKDGRMANASLTNYVIPTSMDMPPMHVDIVEKPYDNGPFGAKGLAEMPMDVPAPAIAAALCHATGLWFPDLPILPETICEAFSNDKANGQQKGADVRRRAVQAAA